MWELDHNSLILVHNYSSEHWRIDAFELWWWRGLFNIPLEKTLMLGNTEVRRRRGRQRMRSMDGITNSRDISLSRLWEPVMDREVWFALVHGVTKIQTYWVTELNWTEVVLGGKEPACQCRRDKRRGFNHWVGKTPWMRAWQLTLVFLPGKSPCAEEPRGLWPIGSQRVGHNWGM